MFGGEDLLHRIGVVFLPYYSMTQLKMITNPLLNKKLG